MAGLEGGEPAGTGAGRPGERGTAYGQTSGGFNLERLSWRPHKDRSEGLNGTRLTAIHHCHASGPNPPSRSRDGALLQGMWTRGPADCGLEGPGWGPSRNSMKKRMRKERDDGGGA